MEQIVSTIAVLIVFALAISILAYQAITGVPPMSSRASEAADVIALLKQAGMQENAIIYELGCGWGSLVVALARAFPEARIRGIEMSPLPYWTARFRTRHFANVQLHRGDFFKFDVRDAQAITCYLMIKPMQKLADFLDSRLNPGTPVVSLTFWFRGRVVTARRTGPGLREAAALYLWPALKSE